MLSNDTFAIWQSHAIGHKASWLCMSSLVILSVLNRVMLSQKRQTGTLQSHNYSV